LFTVGFGVRFTNIQLIHCFASRCHLIIKKQKENAFSKGRTVQKLFAESLFKGGDCNVSFFMEEQWKALRKAALYDVLVHRADTVGIVAILLLCLHAA
jgi:hypothetical protein